MTRCGRCGLAVEWWVNGRNDSGWSAGRSLVCVPSSDYRTMSTRHMVTMAPLGWPNLLLDWLEDDVPF